MKYFYNQLDYGNYQYDMPNGTKATVKSGGCGLCSALNAINNMAGKEIYTVKTIRDFAQKTGARVVGGTDEVKLWKEICKAHKEFSIKTTNSENELIAHLKKGGYAILHQGSAYNVFSTSGHFVCACGMEGNKVKVLDSSYTSTKYKTAPRKNRATDWKGYGCIVDSKQIAKATADRTPNYVLITYTAPKTTKKAETKKTETKKTVKAKTTARLNAYSSTKYGTPAIVIDKGAKVEIIEANVGTMRKNGTTYKMSKVTYNNKNYYCASKFLA